jgi:KH domain
VKNLASICTTQRQLSLRLIRVSCIFTLADIESRNRYLGSADPYEQAQYGMSQNTTNSLTDKAKLIRKIFIPKNNTFNYTGFIIGPKGTNQKRLEEETGCKILVRGKGSQKDGQPAQADDNEDLHVLVAADDPDTLAKGVNEIEKIIFADESTRNELKRIQLNIMAQIKNTELGGGYGSDFGGAADLSHTTPYGPPSMDAKAISVPKDCIGLVIGTF